MRQGPRRPTLPPGETAGPPLSRAARRGRCRPGVADPSSRPVDPRGAPGIRAGGLGGSRSFVLSNLCRSEGRRGGRAVRGRRSRRYPCGTVRELMADVCVCFICVNRLSGDCGGGCGGGVFRPRFSRGARPVAGGCGPRMRGGGRPRSGEGRGGPEKAGLWVAGRDRERWREWLRSPEAQTGRFVLTVKASLHTVPYWHSPLESANPCDEVRSGTRDGRPLVASSRSFTSEGEVRRDDRHQGSR